LLAFAVLFTSVGAPPAGAPTVGGFLYTTVGAVAAGKVREYGTQYHKEFLAFVAGSSK